MEAINGDIKKCGLKGHYNAQNRKLLGKACWPGSNSGLELMSYDGSKKQQNMTLKSLNMM